MKKLNKLLLGTMMIFALALFVRIPVSASTAFYQSDAAVDRVIVSWTPTSYLGNNITRITSLKTADGLYTGTFDSVSRTGTIWVPAGYKGTACLGYKYNNGTKSGSATQRCAISTLPAAPGTTNFNIKNITDLSISFTGTKPVNSTGCQFELLNGWAPVDSDICTATSKTFALADGVLYRYRMRYYLTTAEGRVFYGEWSPFRMIASTDITATAKKNKKGFQLKIRYCPGVSRYDVYVAKSSTAGYKKVSTVTCGRGNKTVWIKKGYKKKGKNYIKVYPIIPGYGSSDCLYSITKYVYK